MFEKERNAFEAEGKKWVEFHIIKEDGNYFHLIMEQEAFKKLPQKKLKMIKSIM